MNNYPPNNSQMGIHFFFYPSQILSLFISIYFLILPATCSDYSKLIYKGCASQKFQDPSGSYSQALKTLFDTLITQSSKTNFSKTTAGESGKNAINGLYQCRGDLNIVDCYNCVNQFPKLARKLCGEVIAARVQLMGCYMKYEVEGFRQVSSTELLYKYCKGDKKEVAAEFEGKRESAFEEVVNGVGDGNGFYAASYGSVYVMGQCEGDLVGSDCSDCVRTALERVKVECGDSMLGQVYLNQCYVSYSYYPNGAGDENASSQETHHNSTKTAAIVVGATAAAGFGLVILLFLKSALKKKSNKYHYGDY